MESLGLTLILAVLVSKSLGSNKEPTEFPYIVSIHRPGETRSFLCAGSLIATSWVLTTATCLTKIACKIRYGEMLTLHNATYSRILRKIHHKNSRSFHYGKPNKRLTPKSNNIGLAKTEEVPHKSLAPLSGIDYYTIFGHEVMFFEFDFEPVFKAKIYQINKGRIVHFRNKNKEPTRTLSPRMNGKVLRTGAGVAILCENHDFPGPTICVASKCYEANENDRVTTYTAPDYGAPLMLDSRIVGVTTEVENTYSTYTPILRVAVADDFTSILKELLHVPGEKEQDTDMF